MVDGCPDGLVEFSVSSDSVESRVAVSVAELVVRRAGDDNVGLCFEDQSWTYREYFAEAVARAHLLLDHRRENAPFHIGVLLENLPDHVFLLSAASLVGATVVGINPTRRGLELERDIRHTDCLVLITEQKFLPLLENVDTAGAVDTVYVVESERWSSAVDKYRGAPAPTADIDLAAPFVLIFTSGTSGDPKASICSQRRLAEIAPLIVERRQITSADTLYCAMSLAHGNGIMAGWSAALAGGATLAVRRKFSASEFLVDVRRFGATLANYVGKVLSYVLATAEAEDDWDNPLRIVYGNEGSAHDLARFSERFGCQVSDAYGSSEGGVSIFGVPDMPDQALGRGNRGTVILDPATGQVCPRARFGSAGTPTNLTEAVGEIALLASDLDFEGYWNNPEAESKKTRDGAFWSGDLGYMDEKDFVYFVGRAADWMRVDGENIAAVTVDSIMERARGAGVVATYAVPDPDVGDQVMLAMVMASDSKFDPTEFQRFLEEQPDLGTKAKPKFVRICSALPMTASNKILTRVLRSEFWEGSDPVWVREGDRYRILTSQDVTELGAVFKERGREHLLGVP